MLESVSEIFELAGAKYLTAVDAEPNRSNQHEIGGLPSIGFSGFLGTPSGGDVIKRSCQMAYLPDEEAEPVTERALVSWYDSRWRNPDRSAEYRMYYPANSVTDMMQEGDLLVVAGCLDGSVVLIITPPRSTIEWQLRHIFGLEGALGSRFSEANLPDAELVLPLRLLLEEIGITAIDTSQVESGLETLLERFPNSWPKTSDVSAMAREISGYDAVMDPDEALMGWMNREEELFRAYEKHVVAERLRRGFGTDGADVDEFMRFSLSVQNRRKSRVGHALENHLTAVFEQNRLSFEKGSPSRVTENGARPDFLFPGFSAYHDPAFSSDKIFLLGAKTTCKDRWRQVLSEGERVVTKYLATLEAGISKAQTDEMVAKNLQLVVPEPIHATYTFLQRTQIYTIKEFVDAVDSSLSRTAFWTL